MTKEGPPPGAGQADASGALRELLFADLEPARAREVFARGADATAVILELADAADSQDPGRAAAALAKVAAAGSETRLFLQAWSLARRAGVDPGDDAKDVLGVVVDMGLDEGLDTLAAFSDGSARYLNHSGAAIVWDAPEMGVGQLVRQLLDAAGAIAVMTGVLDGPRPTPPGPSGAMISVLTRGGIHVGAGTAAAFAADPWAGPVMAAAEELLALLVERAEAARGKRA